MLLTQKLDTPPQLRILRLRWLKLISSSVVLLLALSPALIAPPLCYLLHHVVHLKLRPHLALGSGHEGFY